MPRVPYARWRQMHDRYHDDSRNYFKEKEWDQFKLEVLESLDLCRVPHQELTLLHRMHVKHGAKEER
eukprot:624039-Amphidinium_carterae.1